MDELSQSRAVMQCNSCVPSQKELFVEKRSGRRSKMGEGTSPSRPFHLLPQYLPTFLYAPACNSLFGGWYRPGGYLFLWDSMLVVIMPFRLWYNTRGLLEGNAEVVCYSQSGGGYPSKSPHPSCCDEKEFSLLASISKASNQSSLTFTTMM
eukprot:scaffold19609_cov95-Skeletonema_marinoi.AAC.2